MAKERIYTSCKRCAGSGIATPGGLSPVEDPCSECGGTGQVPGFDTVDLSSADDQAEAAIAALVVKVDALTVMCDKIDNIKNKVKDIQDMLESTVYGLQKMSSNLDDIMVKLDV